MMSELLNNTLETYASGFHVVVSNNGHVIDHKHETELKDAIIYYDLKVDRYYTNKLFKYISVVLFKVSEKRIDKLCEFGNSKL